MGRLGWALVAMTVILGGGAVAYATMQPRRIPVGPQEGDGNAGADPPRRQPARNGTLSYVADMLDGIATVARRGDKTQTVSAASAIFTNPQAVRNLTVQKLTEMAGTVRSLSSSVGDDPRSSFDVPGLHVSYGTRGYMLSTR